MNDNANTVRVQYLSDFHLETKPASIDFSDYIVPQERILLLAGDIAPAFHPKLPKFYGWCIDNFDLTIHIPGNHEYWSHLGLKHNISDTDRYLNELCNEYGIIYGQKKMIDIDNSVNLICACLWTNIPNHLYYRGDFKNIANFNPKKQREIHFDHVDFIQRGLRTSLKQDKPAIVVTHHPPTEEGVLREEHVNGKQKLAYINKLDNLALKCNSWIFGHSHNVCDIDHGGALLTSNPIGHCNEKLPYSRSAVVKI